MSLCCIEDRKQCSQALVRKITEISNAAIARKGNFSLVLSGGATPQYLYKIMASDEWLRQICWEKTHIFFGDERCVAKDHQDSNYRMASQSLLQYLPTPPQQIHRICGENDPLSEASRYDKLIQSTLAELSPAKPDFDLVLLGLGSDGHTASLFPGDNVIHSPNLVTPVDAPVSMNPAVKRISLTLAGIRQSSHIIFLLHGEKKKKIVREILSSQHESYPATLVQQLGPLWFVSGIPCDEFTG